jgi:hypothetical protein
MNLATALASAEIKRIRRQQERAALRVAAVVASTSAAAAQDGNAEDDAALDLLNIAQGPPSGGGTGM